MNQKLKSARRDSSGRARHCFLGTTGGGQLRRAGSGRLETFKLELRQKKEILDLLRQEMAELNEEPGSTVPDPETAKRGAIVRQNPNLTHQELCRQFDFHSVPLPEGWSEGFTVKTWSEAYLKRELRKRIHTIINKHRR